MYANVILQGDSGSALNRKGYDGIWRATGVSAWVEGDCRPQFPTGFTEVAYFIDWIDQVINS